MDQDEDSYHNLMSQDPPLNFGFRKLRQTILKEGLKNLKLLAHFHSRWLANPSAFFAHPFAYFGSAPSLSWSYASVLQSQPSDRSQTAFHKTYIAYRLEERTKQSKDLKFSVKRLMYLEIHPNSKTTDDSMRSASYRRFQYIAAHGQVFLDLAKYNAGLLLVLAPFICSSDVSFLSRFGNELPIKLSELFPQLFEAAKKYRDLAGTILTYMGINLENLPHSKSEKTLSSSLVLDPRTELFKILGGDYECACILFLSHALGGRIPYWFLARIKSPQPRWSDDGTKRDITAEVIGLRNYPLNLTGVKNRLDKALDPFEKVNETDQSPILYLKEHVSRTVSQVLDDRQKERWSIAALMWISFIFPRDEVWESKGSFRTIVDLLTPCLFDTLQRVKLASLSMCLKNEVSEALIVALPKVSLQRRQTLLSAIAKLVDKESPLYLQAALSLQQSILSRLAGDYDDSERFIHDFCCHCEVPTQACLRNFYQRLPQRGNRRLNSLYGRLHASHLENLVQDEKHHLAIQDIDNWKSPNPASPMENRVTPCVTIVISKVFRSHGLFQEALHRLQICTGVLQELQVQAQRPQVLCYIADTLLDLDQSQSASEILALEIERERQKPVKTKALRRFLVSATDAFIQQELYDEANISITELEEIFEDLDNLDTSDELLRRRVLIAQARVCQLRLQFSTAVQKWQLVLEHLQKYKNFESEGFTHATAHVSTALALIELDNLDHARTSFERSQSILRKVNWGHCIPTLYAWTHCALLQIERKTVWSKAEPNYISDDLSTGEPAQPGRAEPNSLEEQTHLWNLPEFHETLIGPYYNSLSADVSLPYGMQNYDYNGQPNKFTWPQCGALEVSPNHQNALCSYSGQSLLFPSQSLEHNFPQAEGSGEHQNPGWPQSGTIKKDSGQMVGFRPHQLEEQHPINAANPPLPRTKPNQSSANSTHKSGRNIIQQHHPFFFGQFSELPIENKPRNFSARAEFQGAGKLPGHDVWEVRCRLPLTVLCVLSFENWDRDNIKTIVTPYGQEKLSSLSVVLSANTSFGTVELLQGSTLAKSQKIQELSVVPTRRMVLKYLRLHIGSQLPPGESFYIELSISAAIEGFPEQPWCLAKFVSQKFLVASWRNPIALESKFTSISHEAVQIVHDVKPPLSFSNSSGVSLEVSAEGSEPLNHRGNLCYLQEKSVEVVVNLPTDKDTESILDPQHVSLSLTISSSMRCPITLRTRYKKAYPTKAILARYNALKFQFSGIYFARSSRKGQHNSRFERFRFLIEIGLHTAEDGLLKATSLYSEEFCIMTDYWHKGVMKECHARVQE